MYMNFEGINVFVSKRGRKGILLPFISFQSDFHFPTTQVTCIVFEGVDWEFQISVSFSNPKHKP